jgi:hypothetical protein
MDDQLKLRICSIAYMLGFFGFIIFATVDWPTSLLYLVFGIANAVYCVKIGRRLKTEIKEKDGIQF